ncbi:MAG: hypothetical protein QFF03_01265 [Pseudomonadota bacterium]|nr:hypothetical protein [Pseudomonadota bacterium]
MKRHSLPLALTIVVHLLLILCVRLARPPALAAVPVTHSVMLVKLAPLPLPRRAFPIARRAPPLPAPARRPPVRVAVKAPQDAPAAAAPAAPAEPPAGAARQDSAAGMLAQARRDVGKIDRDLRAAAPPVPLLQADSAQQRFGHAMAAAFIDRSNTMVVDRYQSGDGVSIERITRGGGSKCYMSGVVNFVPGILHDSSRAQSVSCPPPGSGWTRH